MGLGIEAYNANGEIILGPNQLFISFSRKEVGTSLPSVAPDEFVAIHALDWTNTGNHKGYYIFKVSNPEIVSNYGIETYDANGKRTFGTYKDGVRIVDIIDVGTIFNRPINIEQSYQNYPVSNYAVIYGAPRIVTYRAEGFPLESGMHVVLEEVFKTTSTGFLVKTNQFLSRYRTPHSRSDIANARLKVLLIDVSGL